MRLSILDHNFRLPLFAIILIAANLIFFCNAFAEYSLEINHMNEVTHIEIPGISQADYQIDKKGAVIEIQISGLDPKSSDYLARYADQFIKKVNVTKNQSLSRDIIKIELNDSKLEMFDYLTDAPSSLSIDFYIDDSPKKIADDDSEDDKNSLANRKKDKVNPTRSISSTEFIKQIEDISLLGELDEIRKEQQGVLLQKKKKDKAAVSITTFEKTKPLYDAEKVNFTLNSIIENRGKIFIKFPILFNEDEYLAQLLNRKIEYEVPRLSDAESKDFWKTKRVFSKGDFRNFLKVKIIFTKKYPNSKYTEMISYMEAEAIFSLYKAEGNERFFEESLKMYDGLLAKYPSSNLAERTMLMIAYLRMKKGRYMEGVRSLKLYTERYKSSPLVPNIQLIMAQGLLRLQEYEESLKIYQNLLQSEAPDVRQKAYFDVGDVFFEKKDYQKAIKYYKQALANYPGFSSKYPNVSFNLGESQFLSEKYNDSLGSYKKFIDLFPQHEYAAYAWTRMGEILEIAEVDSKAWRGYYNESFYRFQNTNGGMVAKINLLSHLAHESEGVKFDMVVEELEAFTGKLTIPHASDFLTVKIADTYFNKKFYKKATDILIDYFQKETIPNYEDKFLRRIGRGISFQIREALDAHEPEKAFAIFDAYDSLWLRKSKRHDFSYLKAKGFEQAKLYKKASQNYEKFLTDFTQIPDPEDTAMFEQLPSLDQVRLSYANCLVQEKQFQLAEKQINMVVLDKIPTDSKNELIYLNSKIADSKNDTGTAIEQAKGINKPTLEQVQWLSELYKKNSQPDQAISALDKFLDQKEVNNGQRFELLKTKLSILEDNKNKNKYYDFLKRFHEEFKSQKYDYDREKYQLGAYLMNQDKVKDAEDVWSGIGEKSYWKKMAQESREEKKWGEQYQKYIKRIPAMVPNQEIKQ